MMNGSILTAMPNGHPMLVNGMVTTNGSPTILAPGNGFRAHAVPLPALLIPSSSHARTMSMTPTHVLAHTPSTATTVITPNPPQTASYAYYSPYQANGGLVLPHPPTQANGVISNQSHMQSNGHLPQQINPPPPQHQMSVVLGRRCDLTRPPPSKWLACCCCLLPLWYANCNIYRVIALICNLFVDLLMVLCLLSTNWLTTTKYRQGLWQYCIEMGSPRPLPFGLNSHDGCHWGRDVAYIKLSGFFAVACFVLALIATVLTSFGLSSRDPNRKYTFYRFALYINLAALLAIIVSLTLYPAFFYSELHHTNAVPANRPHWYFGWAYGVGWGSAIFLVGAVLLLVCDKETEEIYYKERTIVHTNHHNHNMHHHNGKA